MKLFWVVEYGLDRDRSVNEKEFLKQLRRVVDVIGNRYYVIVMGNSNRQIDNGVRVGGTRTFGVDGDIENCRKIQTLVLRERRMF